MFANRPIIGIVGGIGSGKSFVARLLGEEGCLVIDSDQQVSDAYRDAQVLQKLREWWGDRVFTASGEIDRKAIAAIIFANPTERLRLEQLLHPWVNEARKRVMRSVEKDAQVLAFVWDTPLLFETGLNNECDAVVFIDTPDAVRLARVMESRGWTEQDLARREKSQMPLDKKKRISDYVISNTADAGHARIQVRDVLSRILALSSATPPKGKR